MRDASVARSDLVLDIGAGSGRLTAELAKRAGSVRAIELDPPLVAALRTRFAGDDNVTVVEADALELALPAAPFRVVANVAFARSGELLARLLDDPTVPLQRADVILQWEAACKRAAVWPGTLRNAVWGAAYELAVVRRLPAACFEPRPRVDAAVLRAVRRAEPLVPLADYGAFRAFVRAGFSARAPSVRVALGPWLSPRALRRAADDLGLDRSARARDLDAYQWATLFAAAAASRGHGLPRPR